MRHSWCIRNWLSVGWMQRTYTNLIIHVISDAGVLRMRRAVLYWWSLCPLVWINDLPCRSCCCLHVNVCEVVIDYNTVQETLSVALYRVVEKNSTLISAIPLRTWEGWKSMNAGSLIKSFWAQKKQPSLEFNLIHNHIQSRHAPRSHTTWDPVIFCWVEM